MKIDLVTLLKFRLAPQHLTIQHDLVEYFDLNFARFVLWIKEHQLMNDCLHNLQAYECSLAIAKLDRNKPPKYIFYIKNQSYRNFLKTIESSTGLVSKRFINLKSGLVGVYTKEDACLVTIMGYVTGNTQEFFDRLQGSKNYYRK